MARDAGGDTLLDAAIIPAFQRHRLNKARILICCYTAHHQSGAANRAPDGAVPGPHAGNQHDASPFRS